MSAKGRAVITIEYDKESAAVTEVADVDVGGASRCRAMLARRDSLAWKYSRIFPKLES